MYTSEIGSQSFLEYALIIMLKLAIRRSSPQLSSTVEFRFEPSITVFQRSCHSWVWAIIFRKWENNSDNARRMRTPNRNTKPASKINEMCARGIYLRFLRSMYNIFYLDLYFDDDETTTSFTNDFLFRTHIPSFRLLSRNSSFRSLALFLFDVLYLKNECS